MLLKAISSFVAGFFPGETLTRAKRKEPKRITDQSVANSDMTDQEVWNIVTLYGKYQEVWPIYRNNGLLEAIKVRDEKAEFDCKVSEIGNPNQSYASPTQQHPPSTPVQRIIDSTSIHETSKKLDELDSALVRSLASYFEEMPGKILHYHRDHHASREEAEVIANYYKKTAGIVRSVQTQQDLKELFTHLEALKKKVSRYQHESFKYRWSTGLEKEVLSKLEKILFRSNLSAL